MTTYIAIQQLTLNGSVYTAGQIIADADVPTTTLRRFIDRGLIEAIGSAAIRTDTAYTSASLAASAQESGVISLAKTFMVLSATTNYPARVRLYTDIESRDADAARAIGTDPTGNHGLIMDLVTTTEDLTWKHLCVAGSVFDETTSCPIIVTNLDSVSRSIVATINWIQMEA
ncbi:MAG: hypothetical protein E6Q97_23550 [Desulfurellales bacterium]|nr:MAG: hypothetical protein E6Q97_23550 [Desulfurellales bacterium]